MKKLFGLILLLCFFIANAGAASLPSAIAKYKYGNYVGCISELNDVVTGYAVDKTKRDSLSKLISVFSKYKLEAMAKNPKDPEIAKLYAEANKVAYVNKSENYKWAYIFYYYALSMHQIGMGNQAKDAYRIALFMSPESKIAEHSTIAINCISNPGACKSSDIEEFVQSGKIVSDDIVRKDLQTNLRQHQMNINKEGGVKDYKNIVNSLQMQQAPPPKVANPDEEESTSTAKTSTKKKTKKSSKKTSFIPNTEKLAWADGGITEGYYEEVSKREETSAPTDEEIGRAVRTLQRAGINPAQYMNPNQMYNAQYAQLNALLNDGSYQNGSYNQMLPYMMMNGGNQKLSPQVMQTLMQQQMMGAYGSF